MKIKRPLFVFAMSVLVVIYSINTMPASVLYCSLALFVLFTLVHRFTTNRYTPHLVLFMLAAVIATSWFGVFKNNLNHKIASLSQYDSIAVEGVIVDKESLGYTCCYYVDLTSANNENIRNFKVAVYSDDFFNEGDILTMTGELKGFTAKSNYLYSYSKGVFAYFYPEKMVKLTPKSSFTSFIDEKRTTLIDNARRIFTYDTISTAVAMGMGEKYLLDNSIKEDFAYTGISHALVVSGLHIGFIAAVLKCLMYFIPVHRKLKNIVLCIFVFMFMALIGFTPSIIRAGCLIIAVTLGRTFLVEVDNYTVLAVLVLITLFTNPYTATNNSLLLSYTAYFGVITGAEICVKKKYGELKTAFLTTLFAVLFTTPLLCMMGMDTTLLAPLFNVLLVYVIMIICVLSFFLPLIYGLPFVGGYIALALAQVNIFCIRFLLQFTEFVKENLSFAMIDTSIGVMKVFVFSTLIAVIIALIQFTDKRGRTIFTLAVPIICLLCYNFMNRDVITVKAFDGTSEPSYVICADNKTYLLATENITYSTFKNALEDLNTDYFDEIIICTLKDADLEMYSDYSDKITAISQTEYYSNDVLSIASTVNNRQMFCVADIGGVTFSFNHNKADMSGKETDFYFFGSSVPKDVSADNYFYFYPVIKKNVDLVTEKQAKELYDILEIKIKNGKYYIMEDVRNFGSRI